MKLTVRAEEQAIYKSLNREVEKLSCLLSRKALECAATQSHSVVETEQHFLKDNKYIIFSVTLKPVSRWCLKHTVLQVSLRWEKKWTRIGLIQKRDLMNSNRRLPFFLNCVWQCVCRNGVKEWHYSLGRNKLACECASRLMFILRIPNVLDSSTILHG